MGGFVKGSLQAIFGGRIVGGLLAPGEVWRQSYLLYGIQVVD